MDVQIPHAAVFPPGSRVNGRGHLEVGGCDTVELAERFGTPLYVYNAQTIREMCREFRAEFQQRHERSRIVYAGKAFLGIALLHLLEEEGLGLDVVSGGELAMAQAAAFPLDNVFFHGNNKGATELNEAAVAGVGYVVVDNLHEISLLVQAAEAAGRRQKVLIRTSPDVDPKTHAKTTTGTLDTKFGLPISTGQAAEAVRRVLAEPALDLRGYHFHLGSPIFWTKPYVDALAVLADFAAEMRDETACVPELISPGGGYAIRYRDEDEPPSIASYAEAIVGSLQKQCQAHNLPLPELAIEPGRAIVGRAGVALYQVGAIKEVPGVRSYVSVDGGMADNIRPALYDARYEAALANRVAEAPTETYRIAGKYCESGDVLIDSVRLPEVSAGDVLAIPGSGAYGIAMASNYNASTRPAVVFVSEGQARLVRRRETYEDLLAVETGLAEGEL
jgi:diaminopimelate decarboxylase